MSDNEPLPIGKSADIRCRHMAWHLRHEVMGVGLTAITVSYSCGDVNRCCASTPLIYEPTHKDWEQCVDVIRSGVQRLVKSRGW